MNNQETREMIETLNAVEKRIDSAAAKAGVSWCWACYSKPSTGGPFLWNDIVVTFPNGRKHTEQALEFVETNEEQ